MAHYDGDGLRVFSLGYLEIMLPYMEGVEVRSGGEDQFVSSIELMSWELGLVKALISGKRIRLVRLDTGPD